jgi:antitoxin PrlF
MKVSQLTVKGQVTLPKELRERFNLKPGSRVAFKEEADGIKVHPVRKTIMDWAGTLLSPVPPLSDRGNQASGEESRGRRRRAGACP